MNASHLPLDIARCLGADCALATHCRRTETPEVRTWVYWVEPQYIADPNDQRGGDCPNFYPVED